MKPNEGIQDDDLRLLTAICDKFEQAMTAGKTAPIRTILDEAPIRLRDNLLGKLLSIQLNDGQRAGKTPDVDECLAEFPDRKEIVLRVFRKANAAADTLDEVERVSVSTPSDVNTNTIIGSSEELFATDTILNATSQFTASAELILDAIFPVYPDGKGYIVEQEIDRGGMGVVLKVRDEHLQRTLALKVIRGQERGDSSHASVNSEMSARFVREAQITGRLDHPGVVPIHELATDKEGRMYFTMKYVQGQTLSKVIPELQIKASQWSLNRVLEVLIRVCETLSFAHSKGVIHRDLKPANIMVGEFGEAYVMDWGLAKIIGESESQAPQLTVPSNAALPRAPQLSSPKHSTARSPSHAPTQTQSQTMYGDVVGTAFYMPPEQAAGRIDELDPRSDVYSLGAVLYEILTGQCPYKAGKRSGREVVKDVVEGPPRSIRELCRKAPPELVAIAEKAMSRSREDRYRDMADMADDLRAFLSQRVVSAYQTGLMARLRKWVVRNQSITIAGLLTLVTIASALGVVALIQLSSQSAMTKKNTELSHTVAEKTKAIRDAEIAGEEKKIARDEVNGLSLMSHSRNLLIQGDPVLASLLGLESVARFPRATTTEVLYTAVAEMVEAVEFDVDSRTSDLAWSRDGLRLLSVHANGTGRIWDTVTNQQVVMIVNSREKSFSTGLFSSDGQSLLTAGSEGGVALWDAHTGIRTLALAIGYQIPRLPNDSLSRPEIVAAAFCVDPDTGAHEARIVAASADRAVHIFDRVTGGELAILQPPTDIGMSPFTIMRVSPDGRSIVVGCEDGNVYIWNDRQQLVKSIEAHNQTIQSIEFSSDSQRFITCAFASSGAESVISSTARCWQTETGELQCEISPEGLHVCSAAFHPLKPWVALGLSDRTLCLWDLDEQRALEVTEPQKDVIHQLDFDEVGDRLVSLSAADELMTCIVQNQGNTVGLTLSERLVGHRGTINRVAYSPSGLSVASATGREVRVWQAGSKNAVPTFGSPSHSGRIHVNHQGDRILEVNSAQQRVRLWSYPDVHLISDLDNIGDGCSARFTDDDLHIALSFADGTCRLCDARNGKLEFETKRSESMVFQTCFGSLLCLGDNDEATVWDWTTGAGLHTFSRPKFGQFRVRPDGSSILAQRQDREDGTMTNIDPASGTEIEIVNSETCNPGYFSRSGRYFWCHGSRHEKYDVPFSSHVKLIDTHTNQVLFVTQGGDPLVRNVRLNDTDTRMLVDYVQRSECTAEIYSIPDGKLIAEIGPPEGEVSGWSTDLRFVTIVSDAAGTQLWETANNTMVSSLEIGGSNCETVSFSPDNRYLAVQLVAESQGSDEKSSRVALWSTTPLTLITVLPGENRSSSPTTFFPDGERFWTMSGDNQIRIWPLEIVKHAKKHIPRSLTVDEERMYGVDESRQVPTEIPADLSPRSLPWHHLTERIRLLSPVTAERRNMARNLLGDVRKWLSDKATQKEISLALTAVDRLRSGPFDTDPMVLEGIAELHKDFGERAMSVRLLELAARHPRAFELDDKLLQARAEIFPQLVSLRSADPVAEAAFAEAATPEQKASFEKSLAWAVQNSPRMAGYLMARKHLLESHPELAKPLLQTLADSPSTSVAETGPELFLQLAECELASGQAQAAASVLRTALNEERFRAPEVWNRWLQISFANLGLTPQTLIAQLPEKTVGTPPEPRYEDNVSWLLEQLSQSRPMRINCGGDRYVASGLAVWESDRFFTHGHAYFGTDGDASLFAEPIANTNDPLLFQSERWFSNNRHDKPAGYQIPMPNGDYEIRLGFAEIFEAKRNFDVVINETTVLTEYDPGRGAWATADTVVVQTTVHDGRLNISFVSQNDEHPKISCLQVVRIGARRPAD